jgi:hypothetical protein
MVEPLADRPSHRSMADWVDNTKRSANLNPIVNEDSISVNGLPAFRVLYRNVAQDLEIEATYVVSGSRMFEISVDGEPHAKLHDLPIYSIYQRMLATFAVQTRAPSN